MGIGEQGLPSGVWATKRNPKEESRPDPHGDPCQERVGLAGQGTTEERLYKWEAPSRVGEVDPSAAGEGSDLLH